MIGLIEYLLYFALVRYVSGLGERYSKNLRLPGRRLEDAQRGRRSARADFTDAYEKPMGCRVYLDRISKNLFNEIESMM